MTLLLRVILHVPRQPRPLTDPVLSGSDLLVEQRYWRTMHSSALYCQNNPACSK